MTVSFALWVGICGTESTHLTRGDYEGRDAWAYSPKHEVTQVVNANGVQARAGATSRHARDLGRRPIAQGLMILAAADPVAQVDVSPIGAADPSSARRAWPARISSIT